MRQTARNKAENVNIRRGYIIIFGLLGLISFLFLVEKFWVPPMSDAQIEWHELCGGGPSSQLASPKRMRCHSQSGMIRILQRDLELHPFMACKNWKSARHVQETYREYGCEDISYYYPSVHDRLYGHVMPREKPDCNDLAVIELACFKSL
jgi:hypothetical protein